MENNKQPKLEPLVEDLYGIIERYCGNPLAPYKLKGNERDLHYAMMAALIIWSGFASRGSQTLSAEKIKVNRNTIRKHLRENKYLEPINGIIFGNRQNNFHIIKHQLGLENRA